MHTAKQTYTSAIGGAGDGRGGGGEHRGTEASAETVVMAVATAKAG